MICQFQGVISRFDNLSGESCELKDIQSVCSDTETWAMKVENLKYLEETA